MKKFLQRQDINTNKMKLMKGYVFASFRNEEERDKAMEKLKGIVYKGNTLDVKVCIIILCFSTFNLICSQFVLSIFIVGKAYAGSSHKEKES